MLLCAGNMPLHNVVYRFNLVLSTSFLFLLVLLSLNWLTSFLVHAEPEMSVTLEKVDML